MIPIAYPKGAVDKEMIKAVVDTLNSGRYVMGGNSKGFEREFSSFCGTKAAVSTSSGTTALHLTLTAIGIGAGDEVITTPHTFIATSNSIIHTGAKPVFVDIDPDTHNIDASKIEAAITPKTKAIIPVHIYGTPADMDAIMEIAEQHGLKVVEDACQAAGAEYRGRKTGSMGNAGCFSFFPSKVMTVGGEGGMVVTSDEELERKMVALRDQGRMPGEKYRHDMIGFNYRMGEISAAIGLQELKHLPEWLERRRKVAKEYSRLLQEVDNVKPPTEKEWAKSSYYVYTITVPSQNREKLIEWLRGAGIQAGIYYPMPLHLQPAYSGMGFRKGMFPVAEDIVTRILALPMHQYLKAEEIEFVAKKVAEFKP